MALNGIDVSNNNGASFRPSKVKADFVICKATEGTSFKDAYFETFMNDAINAGRLVGAYHFASSKVSPERQASAFLEKVKPYLGKALLVLDWENAGNYDLNVLSQGPSFAKRFLDSVYDQTGTRPLIYMSKSVCREYDWTSVAKNYDLWVAQYANYNPIYGYSSNPWTDSGGYGAWKSPAIFQYTSELFLSGWGNRLDGNVAYMTREGWANYAKGNAVPSESEDSAEKDGKLVVDGLWGTATTRALQEHFGTPQDGIVSHQWPSNAQPAFTSGWQYDKTGEGSTVMRAIQGALGVHQDGLIGPTTINALQTRMGTPVDGELWENSPCVKEMQRRLNKGTF